jgi:predicted amidohydrolase
MKQLTVGGCRIPVGADIQANLKEIKKSIDWAADNSVDIMSVPECALSGYMWAPESQEDPRVIELDLALQSVMLYAKEKAVDLVLGTAWYDADNHWTNMQMFIVEGKCQHVHRKNVLFGTEMQYYQGGNDSSVFEYKGFNIAGLICNDLWSNTMFWPSASAMLLTKLQHEKADVVFVSANVPRDASHAELFYQWHEACIRMFGGTGRWNTVVSETAHTNPISICPVGVVGRNAMWATKGHDIETCYFKHVVN